MWQTRYAERAEKERQREEERVRRERQKLQDKFERQQEQEARERQRYELEQERRREREEREARRLEEQRRRDDERREEQQRRDQEREEREWWAELHRRALEENALWDKKQAERELERQLEWRPIPEHLRLHTAIIARTGWGKTQLLQWLVLNELMKVNPPSIVVLDSTGAMVNLIQRLAVFDQRLKDRIVIIDPELSPSLNMFDLSTHRYAFVMWGIPIRYSFCKEACRRKWEAERAAEARFLAWLHLKPPSRV